MLNFFRLNRRGLSPIFATLIILAVVTVLFIPVFIWVSGMTSSTDDSWKQAGVAATERIVVEEVDLRGGQVACTIYVRNIGQTAVSINNVLISRADGTGSITPYENVNANPTSVVQGDLITVTISDLGFNPGQNTAYLVKVYTSRGVGDSYQVVA